jgi:hypothetical protein
MKSKPNRNRWLKMRHDEDHEQSREALSKKVIRPLLYRIAKASGSKDVLSRSWVHAGTQDGVDYADDTQAA